MRIFLRMLIRIRGEFILTGLFAFILLLSPPLSPAQEEDISDSGSAPGTTAVLTPAELGSSSRWAVFDAASREVGTVVGISGIGLAVVSLGFRDESFLVEVDRSGFIGNTGGIYFESPDCSGDPLIIYRETLSPLVTVAPPGSTVYFADKSLDSPLDAVTHSVLSAVTGKCEQKVVSGLQLIPSKPLVDLFLVFKPPFSLRLVAVE